MATNVAGPRYRTWYAMLLRLYPRPFRERFGEGMAQTFHDLCQERKGARRGLFGFALWIFCETLVGIVKENTTHMPQLGKTMLRVALLAGFALGWSNMVHVADSGNPANLMYYSVLAVGAVGACLARLKARGLALTLFAMAATLALIAVTLPSGAPPYLARNMAIGHGVCTALFTASGLMFRHASLAGLK